jgi:hypothetical protein
MGRKDNEEIIDFLKSLKECKKIDFTSVFIFSAKK